MTCLTKKRIVIIGGASGIGLSAALVFVKEDTRGVVVDRDKDTSLNAEKLLYAGENIRIKGITPALVETPMAQRSANDEIIQSFIKINNHSMGTRASLANKCL